MVFAESIARWLLVAHTAAALACVGASTHLAVWLRSWRRGRFTRVRAVRRFALISAGLYVATLVIGNLLYPTYKVRVRAQFLENPSEITREVESRERAARRVESLYGPGAPETIAPPTEKPARNAAKVARWFDVKEHWVVFGAVLAIAVALIVWGWDPRREPGGAAIGPVIFWMAVGASGAAWLAAIIGVVVSSYRAVGGL